MNILVLNGPNLNLLGRREPEIYGRETYEELVDRIEAHCARLGVKVEVRQSNHEGVLVDWIQQAAGAFEGIVINPAAYTHTSVALRDALAAVGIPFVEVHLSNVFAREPFRHHSYFSDLAIGVISGLGSEGYSLALEFLLSRLNAD